MKDNTKKFDPELYKGTYKYYIKYRPPIPKEVIDVIVEHFDVKPTDRVLDLGCGTGQVALAMEGKCGEMVCLDPDPEMLRWAKKVTKHLKMKLTWLNYAAEDLGKIKKKLGTFKVATCSRAFHRMNQDLVLKELAELIDEKGGVAIFSDMVLWKGNEEWQQALKKILQKYLEGKSQAGKEKPIKPEERWENILARSAFKVVKTYEVTIIRNWNIKSIIGYIFSTAAAAPSLFNEEVNKFKKEVKNILLTLNPQGVFRENALWSIVLGSKKLLN